MDDDIKYRIDISSSWDKWVNFSNKEGGFNDDEPSFITNIPQYIDSYVIKSHRHVQMEKSEGKKE